MKNRNKSSCRNSDLQSENIREVKMLKQLNLNEVSALGRADYTVSRNMRARKHTQISLL